MSRRRKHVRNQLEELCPELNDGDAVCRVVELRGGNQVQVRDDVDVRSARRRVIASRSSLVSHWSPYDRVRVVNADP